LAHGASRSRAFPGAGGGSSGDRGLERAPSWRQLAIGSAAVQDIAGLAACWPSPWRTLHGGGATEAAAQSAAEAAAFAVALVVIVRPALRWGRGPPWTAASRTPDRIASDRRAGRRLRRRHAS